MSVATQDSQLSPTSIYRQASTALFCLGLLAVALDLIKVGLGNPWDNQGYMNPAEQFAFIMCRNINHALELIFPAALIAALLRGVAVIRLGIAPSDVRFAQPAAIAVIALGVLTSGARLFDGVWKHGPETMGMTASQSLWHWVKDNAPFAPVNLAYSIAPALILLLLISRAKSRASVGV